jgi:hypothetical protein
MPGGWRLGNLMRSFRDSVVLWRTRTGCPVIGSALTNSGVFSSPSLSSSIISAGGSDAGWERETVGLAVRAGPGVGPGVRRTTVLGIWLGVWLSEMGIGDAGVGGAGVGGGGVGAGKSGAREGVVSSKVR